MRNFINVGRKIVAVGRNYVDHAKELNNPVPKSPFFFLKPTSSYIEPPNAIEIPEKCEVHYEVELGVVIGKDGKDISSSEAMNHVGGYCLAIDMTARNLQDLVKKKGLPWSAAKGFDTFTPVSKFIEKSKVTDPHNLNLWLKVDQVVKQNGTTKDMIFDIPYLIEHISTIMKLQEGDVILTGTPKGVGRVIHGQTIQIGLEKQDGEKLVELEFPVIDSKGKFKFVAP